MKRHLVIHILALALLLLPTGGSLQARALPQPPATEQSAQIGESNPPESPDALPGGGDWWGAAQEEIRQSEYQITWQDQTYLADVSAAYQAPNRAQNLRAYFTPEGVRVIPRDFAGDTAPWEWGLSLSGYHAAGDPANANQFTDAAPRLTANANHIEYHHLSKIENLKSKIVEWYVNDARGLEHGFTLSAPPQGTESGAIALDMALTGNLTPHLVAGAIEFSTPGGVTVLRYGELHVADADGRPLPARLELPAARTVRIAIEAAGARYPLTVDPLATTPAWSAESNQADAEFGRSVATAGDVNGDGYSDVIIGASMYDGGQSDEGRAFVYYGSATGLNSSADWTAESDQASAQLGVAVATAGDVNGDGYSDVIVGSHQYDNDEIDEGRAYVYYGSAAGLSAAANWTAESNQANALFGYSVATAGDINGDGYSDVIVGAYQYDDGHTDEGCAFIYFGSASGLASTPNWTVESNQDGAYFGVSVGTAGDVNGDGYSDIIVGANMFDNGETNEGGVYVYHGGPVGVPKSPSWSSEANQAEARFGYSAGTAGDVNGDGYSDVIVGAFRYDNGEMNEGGTFVYHGSATGLSAAPAWTAGSNQINAYFGFSVGAAGDVNGDGYGDVIVGAYQYDNGEADEGQARVYFGADAGLSLEPDWSVESNQAEALFGYSVATAGDINGDGYSDLIVGALEYDNGETDEGCAFVYHGAASGLAEAPAWTANSDQETSFFGRAVSTAGDVNGDGYSDVIVGAAFYDNGEADEGRVYAYYGAATGLSAAANWTDESDQANAWFGVAVATAGDVNGDGYGDVIVGAAREGGDRGWAYVYYGAATGLSVNPNWTVSGGNKFGGSVATAGDVNGDGYSDVVVGTPSEVQVYYGSSAGLSAVPDWSVNTGNVGATAGDVNRDGYSDVIVGDSGYQAVGRALVYYGSTTGLQTTPAWSINGDQSDAKFGDAVAAAGDVNGDGYGDVIIGASEYDNAGGHEGRAFVYHGSATGLSATFAWSAGGVGQDARFGSSVAAAGDVNGDGYSEIIVGAWYYANGQSAEGMAAVYQGSSAGLANTPAWSAEGNIQNAAFGRSVGVAGDVNGDGYADVIVGAHGGNGRASVYYGNNGDGLHVLPRQMRTENPLPIAPLGMSDAGDAFQLRLIGRMPLGRDDVRLQWQAAPLGLSFSAPDDVITGMGAWLDTLNGSVNIQETVSGLSPNTAYHWRARLLYRPGNALGLPASRWIHTPAVGWNETDLRTAAGNQRPIANAGPDQTVMVNTVVTLDGSASSDPDGNYPLIYGWNQVGGEPVTFTQNLSVTTFTAPASPMTLTFALFVIDSLGDEDIDGDSVSIRVVSDPINQPPVANAGPDQTVAVNATVTLDGSASSDPDGNYPLSYGWTQTGGEPVTFTGNLSVTTFTAPAGDAVLTFTLAVSDSLGLPDPTPDEVVITVGSSSATHDLYIPLALRQYPPVPYAPTLNAIANDDHDGNYTVSWNAANPKLEISYQLQEATNADFSNATTAYGGIDVVTTISGRAAGTYYYRVRGRNNFGDGAWSNVQAVQTAPPNLFLAGADTTVKQGAAGTAFGADVLMGAGYDHCGTGQASRGLVNFNLAPVPAGAPITKAVLRLHLTQSCDYEARSHTVTTYRVSGAWDEATLTWNSQPAAAEAYGAVTLVSRDAWGWYEFDVTALVQGWVNGQYPNYGIMLRSNEESGNHTALLEFDTRETTNLPHLQITYAGMARTADAVNGAPPAVKTPLTMAQALQPAPLCADCAPFAIATAK